MLPVPVGRQFRIVQNRFRLRRWRAIDLNRLALVPAGIDQAGDAPAQPLDIDPRGGRPRYLGRIEGDAQQLCLHRVHHHPVHDVVMVVVEPHVPRRFQFDRRNLVAGHEISDHRQHVLAHIRVRRREGMEQRIAKRRVGRHIRIPLANPAIVQAHHPCHVFEPVGFGHVEQLRHRAVVRRHQRVYPRLNSSVRCQVGLKVQRAIFRHIQLPLRVVRQDEFPGVVRGRQVDRRETRLRDPPRCPVVAFRFQIPRVGVQSSLHRIHILRCRAALCRPRLLS